MVTRDPTYLLQRHGIYHFHLRIPKHLKSVYGDKIFIRKSLKTSCRHQALSKARVLWVEIMTKKVKSNEQIDAEIEESKHLYNRGKILSKLFEIVDRDDALEFDLFTDTHFGQGDYSSDFDWKAFKYYQENYAFEQKHIVVQSSGAPEDVSMKELVAKFLTERRIGRSVDKKSQNELDGIFRNIIALCGNPLVSNLTNDLITHNFSKNLQKIPSNLRKKKQYKSANGFYEIYDCIKIAELENLPIISYRTQKKYIIHFKEFLNWSINRDYIDKKSILALEFFKKVKNNTPEHEKSYSSNELKVIFYDDIYASGEFHEKEDYKHFGIILALYTGMRANEIAQIEVQDIKQKNNIWYIDLLNRYKQPDGRTIEKKKLKTKSSRRIIPIHNHLIALGFLNFYNHKKKLQHTFLFQELLNEESKIQVRRMTDWYRNTFLKKLINSNKVLAKKNFHSFRHTFIDATKQQDIKEKVGMEIAGHSDKSSVHAGYQQDYKLEIRHTEINKIDFGLDLSKIKKWE